MKASTRALLIDWSITLVILGILAAVIVPQFIKAREVALRNKQVATQPTQPIAASQPAEKE